MKNSLCVSCYEPIKKNCNCCKFADFASAHSMMCVNCMCRYIKMSVNDMTGFFAPIKCQICQSILTYNRWSSIPELSEVAEKYYDKIQQSVSIMCGGCHLNVSLDPIFYEENVFDIFVQFQIESEIKKIKPQLSLYIRGSISASKFYETLSLIKIYNNDDFDVSGDFVFNIIRSISNPERRITLWLRHLKKHNIIHTHCCSQKHCFNCKIVLGDYSTNSNHNCINILTIENNNQILKCPECDLILSKSDGCDSVKCPCGVMFNWSTEIQKQKYLIYLEIHPTNTHEHCAKDLMEFDPDFYDNSLPMVSWYVYNDVHRLEVDKFLIKIGKKIYPYQYCLAQAYLQNKIKNKWLGSALFKYYGTTIGKLEIGKIIRSNQLAKSEIAKNSCNVRQQYYDLVTSLKAFLYLCHNKKVTFVENTICLENDTQKLLFQNSFVKLAKSLVKLLTNTGVNNKFVDNSYTYEYVSLLDLDMSKWLDSKIKQTSWENKCNYTDNNLFDSIISDPTELVESNNYVQIMTSNDYSVYKRIKNYYTVLSLMNQILNFTQKSNILFNAKLLHSYLTNYITNTPTKSINDNDMSIDKYYIKTPTIKLNYFNYSINKIEQHNYVLINYKSSDSKMDKFINMLNKFDLECFTHYNKTILPKSNDNIDIGNTKHNMLILTQIIDIAKKKKQNRMLL